MKGKGLSTLVAIVLTTTILTLAYNNPSTLKPLAIAIYNIVHNADMTNFLVRFLIIALGFMSDKLLSRYI